MVASCLLFGSFKHCLRMGHLFVQLTDVDKFILLLVLDEIEFKPMRLLLNLVIWLLQFGVKLFVLVCPVFFLLEYLAMIFILVGHFLSFFL